MPSLPLPPLAVVFTWGRKTVLAERETDLLSRLTQHYVPEPE